MSCTPSYKKKHPSLRGRQHCWRGFFCFILFQACYSTAISVSNTSDTQQVYKHKVHLSNLTQHPRSLTYASKQADFRNILFLIHALPSESLLQNSSCCSLQPFCFRLPLVYYTNMTSSLWDSASGSCKTVILFQLLGIPNWKLIISEF